MLKNLCEEEGGGREMEERRRGGKEEGGENRKRERKRSEDRRRRNRITTCTLVKKDFKLNSQPALGVEGLQTGVEESCCQETL